MSDSPKNAQEVPVEPKVETPSMQEESSIESLVEVPVQQAEEVLVESRNEDSANKTEKKPAEQTEEITNTDNVEQKEDGETPFEIITVETFSKIEAANAPKTEEEFYKTTFDTFKKINDYTGSSKVLISSESTLSDMQPMAEEYLQAISNFQQYSDNNQELQNLASIWDLAIQLFISPEASKDRIVRSLIDWINQFDPIEQNNEDGDWASLFRHILRGNIEEAINLLTSFNLDQNEKKFVEPLCNTLREYKDVSSEDRLEDWKRKCAIQLDIMENVGASDFQFKDNFIWIYFLLMGNPNYIKRTGAFFDQLAGAIQYYKLHVSRREITTIAAELDCSNFKDQCSLVCAALLLGRIDDALQYCNNIWMQTHLGHVFLALGLRAESKISTSSSPDTEVIVDPIYQVADIYAHHIAEKYNMWTEAILYINLCIPNRVVWIQRLLKSPNAKNILILENVLQTVDEYSIHEVKHFIHKSIGQLYEKENNVHEATIEYGRAQDIQSLDRIGTDLFNQCLETGKLQNNVVGYEGLRSSPIYDCIMKYQDLRNSLEKKKYKEASRIVLDIFASNILPDEFKPMIFIDADAILLTKESFYSQNELIELLDIFQALLDSLSSQNSFKQYYQHARGTKYTTDTIIAMLREKMAYKAMIAATAA